MRFWAFAAAAVAFSGALLAHDAQAQTCRAQQIITNQCIWFALTELGGDLTEAKRAEQLATSTLVAGCSRGEYQMVLLRGTDITQRTIDRLRARGARDTRTVQVECAAAAKRAVSR
jgi:hypothetical protein